MRHALPFVALVVAGCQSVPNVQTPILLSQKAMIVVRHNGGSGDGACPMWVKVDGVHKGELLQGRSVAIDVESGVRTVSLGRSANGVYGRGVVCTGSMQTSQLVARDVEVADKPVRLAYEMQGTGKRWIPVVGFFLAPTPVLIPDKSSAD